MRVDFINYPYVFTDTGERIEIKQIKGQPVVGATLSQTEQGYEVTGNSNDSDCVSGVCPIK